MQETEGALCVFIQKMGDDVFILLCLLDREKGLLDPFRATTVLIFFFLIPSLLRDEGSVHTHKTRAPSYVLIHKPAQEVDYSHIFGFSAHIQQHDVFRVEIAAKSLEKPKMGGQFGAVEMFEAGEEFEMTGVGDVGSIRVGDSRMP
jgi:hypothetical protein